MQRTLFVFRVRKGKVKIHIQVNKNALYKNFLLKANMLSKEQNVYEKGMRFYIDLFYKDSNNCEK